MEALLIRILIQEIDGDIIAYLYNREAFDLLKIEKQTYDNSQFVEVGQIIVYNGKKYKVDHFNIKMEEKLFDVNPNIGMNMYSPNDPSDFNCQIGVFVNSVE